MSWCCVFFDGWSRNCCGGGMVGEIMFWFWGKFCGIFDVRWMECGGVDYICLMLEIL